MVYTKKQLELMRIWQKGQLKRINLLEGSVSSGKTWISLVLWAFWVKTMPRDGAYMMCAKSLTTLKRNCLLLLQEMIGEVNFSFSIASKEGRLFGRKVFLEGANDIRSESKIRGLTLQGVYCDELTQFPRDFFVMLLSRLRKPGAIMIGTTNPGSPNHWLKEEYIDRSDELSFLDMKFLLDDNTTLPADYIENIKKEYTGVFYERFILGLWTLAEGIIYPMFREAVAQTPDGSPTEWGLSIDYGTYNAFAALLWGKYGDVWYCVKEYYYSGRNEMKQKTDEEYGDDLDKFVECVSGKIDTVIDPSAASFITLLRRKGKYRVLPANNDVLNGIRETQTAMERGIIKFDPRCKNVAKEMGSYCWDDKNDDTPIKENDHAADAIRYWVHTKQIATPKVKYRSLFGG